MLLGLSLLYGKNDLPKVAPTRLRVITFGAPRPVFRTTECGGMHITRFVDYSTSKHISDVVTRIPSWGYHHCVGGEELTSKGLGRFHTSRYYPTFMNELRKAWEMLKNGFVLKLHLMPEYIRRLAKATAKHFEGFVSR